MKKFFKVFIIFLFCVFQCGNVDALSLKDVMNKEFRTEPYAEIYAYFEDYAMRLYEAFDARKSPIRLGFCALGAYTLHKDGTVSDPRYSSWNYPPPDSDAMYVFGIVQTLTPKPFPKELEDDEIKVKVSFCKVKHDRITLAHYQTYKRRDREYEEPNAISIDISKTPKNKDINETKYAQRSKNENRYFIDLKNDFYLAGTENTETYKLSEFLRNGETEKNWVDKVQIYNFPNKHDAEAFYSETKKNLNNFKNVRNLERLCWHYSAVGKTGFLDKYIFYEINPDKREFYYKILLATAGEEPPARIFYYVYRGNYKLRQDVKKDVNVIDFLYRQRFENILFKHPL